MYEMGLKIKRKNKEKCNIQYTQQMCEHLSVQIDWLVVVVRSASKKKAL